MDWLEIIYLRSHTEREKESAMAAFRHLLPPARNAALKKIVLFQNRQVATDLSIYIFWRGRASGVQKSPLGLQLAAAFADFGQINHSVWTHAATIISTCGRQRDETQPAI